MERRRNVNENTEKKTCNGPECDRPVRANGLCGTHNKQRRTRGPDNLIPIGSYVRPAREGCEFEGCDRKHYGLGYCQQHHRQKWRSQKLRPIGEKKGERLCDFPGCERKHLAHGWCKPHYRAEKAGRTLKPIKVDQVNDNETGE